MTTAVKSSIDLRLNASRISSPEIYLLMIAPPVSALVDYQGKAGQDVRPFGELTLSPEIDKLFNTRFSNFHLNYLC